MNNRVSRMYRHRKRHAGRWILLAAVLSSALPAVSPWRVLPVKAETAEDDNIHYKGLLFRHLNDQEVYVSAVSEVAVNIEIPASVPCHDKTCKVTAIGREAFTGMTELQSIILPEGITVIESQAFAMCVALEQIQLPESLKMIGKEALHHCISLASLHLPAQLQSIGISAFEGCSQLTAVEIPSSVSSIGNYAFFNCPELKKIIFDGDHTDLGSHVFPSQHIEVYGPDSETPSFLAEKYSQITYAGKYEGQNLNVSFHPGWNYLPAEGKYVYADTEGSLKTDAWLEEDGKYYHLNSQGFMDTGWQTIGDTAFYFGKDGAMAVQSWIPYEGQLYYVDESGCMRRNQWKEQGDACYYLGDSGAMSRNQLMIWQGVLYWIQADGVMATDRNLGGYSFDSAGRCRQTAMKLPEDRA